MIRGSMSEKSSRAMADLASRRFNEDPVSFLDPLSRGGFRMDLHNRILLQLPQARDLASLRAEEARYAPSGNENVRILLEQFGRAVRASRRLMVLGQRIVPHLFQDRRV